MALEHARWPNCELMLKFDHMELENSLKTASTLELWPVDYEIPHLGSNSSLDDDSSQPNWTQ